MTRISDIFYGDNTTNIILKKEWLPSTGLYPTDTTEGIMYIAADDGNVSGTDFSEDDVIIYKDSEWVAIGGGGGTEVIVSDTAPTSPTEGTLWWNSSDVDGGSLYLWYVGEAPNVPTWVPVSGIGSGGGGSSSVVNTLRVISLPTYADDAAAGSGGLLTGDVYKTVTGELRIKL